MSRIAFLFPGQGAQYVGMGQELYNTIPEAKRLFDEATEILGYDLREVCEIGPEERLNSTKVSQPAIFVASLAALEKLRTQEGNPETECVATAGLSLGEYTSLVFAGAMTFADGLRLVQRRGEAMQEAADATASGMVSVLGLEVEKLEQVCQQASEKGIVKIANLLCPGNIVVSGVEETLTEVEKRASEAGAMKCIRLAVAGAFHTELMKPADERLAEALAKADIQKPRIPVWSNVDAKPHSDPAEIRELLVQQVLNPVLWEQTIRNLIADGVEEFYELGPKRVLAGLIKRVERKRKCTNIEA